MTLFKATWIVKEKDKVVEMVVLANDQQEAQQIVEHRMLLIHPTYRNDCDNDAYDIEAIDLEYSKPKVLSVTRW
jgi:hypothetical protein